MVNLRNEFERAAQSLNESLTHAVIGGYDGYYGDPNDTVPDDTKHMLLSWSEAKQFLNYSYNNGFGVTDCHAVVAWSDNYVYYVQEYDGSTCIRTLPSRPISHDVRF